MDNLNTYYKVALVSLTLALNTACSSDDDDTTETPTIVAVESIDLGNALNLDIGASSQITASVSPSNASDTAIAYSSSDSSIATVSASGEVTAIAEGSVTITAINSASGVQAVVNITVTDPTVLVTAISLGDDIALDVGATSQLSATATPDNATDATVTFASSDETVATVNASGEVTAVAAGTATITATNAASGVEGTVEVTVSVPVVLVTSIDLGSELNLVDGETSQLNATTLPANATSVSISYASSDAAVASVDNSGLVTATGVGTATITATDADSNVSSTVEVTVTANSIALISIDMGGDLTLSEGDTSQLNATFNPLDATDQTLTYATSADAVATVSDSGLITAVAAGTASITATNAESGIVATITVTVEAVAVNTAISVASVSVPECMSSAVYASTSVDGTMVDSGVTFDWSLSDAAVTTELSNGVVDGYGYVNLQAPTGAVGETSTIQVTGTPSGGTASDTSVTATVVDSASCETNPSNYNTFLGQFEMVRYFTNYRNPSYTGDVPSWVPNWWATWWPHHEFVPTANSEIAATDDGMTDNALTITAGADATTATEVGAYYVSWFNGASVADPAMVMENRVAPGVEIKAGVWVQLSNVPASGNLTLKHYIYSQNWTGYSSYVPDGGETKTDKHRRENPSAGHFEAVLKNTTDWQYVEFVNADGSGATWTVPAEWYTNANATAGARAGSAANWQFVVTGLEAGHSIKLDEYSMMIISE